MPFFSVGGLDGLLLSHMRVGAAVITVERMDPPAMVELIERERVPASSRWTLLDRITAYRTLADRDLSLARGDRGIGRSPDPAYDTTHSGCRRPAPCTLPPPRPRGRCTCRSGCAAGLGHRFRACSTKWSIPRTPLVELPDGVEGDLLVRGYSLMDSLYKKERSETFDDDGWYRDGATRGSSATSTRSSPDGRPR